MEYDVMCIMDGKDIEAIEIKEYPGYANLQINAGSIVSNFRNFTSSNSNLLSLTSFTSKRYSKIAHVVGGFGTIMLLLFFFGISHKLRCFFLKKLFFYTVLLRSSLLISA